MSATCAAPGAMEWPLRVLLVIGGFVIATPGGGIMPLSQMQITLLGLAILVPTVLVALLLIPPPNSGAGAVARAVIARQNGRR